jgi:hypothetical protein
MLELFIIKLLEIIYKNYKMKEKNLYQIRGKATESNLKDQKTVDKLSILLPPKHLSKFNTDRKKIYDRIGKKYLIKDIYKNCECPIKCEPCPLDAPYNQGIKYFADEIAKINRKVIKEEDKPKEPKEPKVIIHNKKADIVKEVINDPSLMDKIEEFLFPGFNSIKTEELKQIVKTPGFLEYLFDAYINTQ